MEIVITYGKAQERVLAMGLIVFIHGMGNNPNKAYWKSWGENLRTYLIGQGIDECEINFDGVYYYDLVPQPGDGWKRITPFYYRDTVNEMRSEMWHYIVGGGDIHDMLGRGPLDGLVNLVADNFGDIYCYLHYDEVFTQVNYRLYQALEKAEQPVTLVAYSLGSMIAYCALQRRQDLNVKINAFITMGSPIFWFRKWLAKRTNLAQRPTTAPWINLAGKLDVACPHLVGYQGCCPDQTMSFIIDKFNPIRGHLSYHCSRSGLQTLAKAIACQWQKVL